MKNTTPLFAALLLANASMAHAVDISVIGLFPGKAVLVVDGAQPKTYSVGANVGADAKLLSVDSNSAVLEIGGKRQTLAMGQHINRAPAGSSGKVVLQADSRGHFITMAQVNGGVVQMLVDTGATTVALPATDALRLGIDYRRGKIAHTQTANGTAQVYQITLERVKVGDLEVLSVPAVVMEGGLGIGLLGMSFLKRIDMHRQGENLTLTKSY